MWILSHCLLPPLPPPPLKTKPRWLLPGDSNDGSRSDLMFGLFVPPGATAVGKTVKEAGLLQAAGANLVSVMHKGHVSSSISPQYVIHAQDTLYLQGELCNRVLLCMMISSMSHIYCWSDACDTAGRSVRGSMAITNSHKRYLCVTLNPIRMPHARWRACGGADCS